MRLIDADALKRDICKYCNDVYSDEPCEPSDCEHMRIIDNQPTIDAVEVVRRKDCRFYEENAESRTRFCRRGLNYQYAVPDGFCSYGERKTE